MQGVTFQTFIGSQRCIITAEIIRTRELASFYDYRLDFQKYTVSDTVTVQLIGAQSSLTPDQYFWYRYWFITLWQSNDVWHFDCSTGTTDEIIIFGKCSLTSNIILYDGRRIRPWRHFRINNGTIEIINRSLGDNYLSDRRQVLAFVAMSLALDLRHDLIY